MRKKIFLFLLIMSIILSFTTCLAAQPQKVAILPVITPGYIKLDQAYERQITQALERKFHTSLASLVPVFELLPADTIQTDYTAIQTDNGKPVLDKALLQAMAAATQADIVIAAEVTSFRALTHRTWDNEEVQETDVALHIASYQKSSDSFLTVRDRQTYRGTFLLSGRPDYILDDLLYRLLNKLPNYRQ